MIEVAGLPDHPIRFAAILLLAGFAAISIAKIYGLFFMRWKSPYRMGQSMNVQHAEVVEWTESPAGGEGYVKAGGELWRATSKDSLKPGDEVKVAAVNGLTLSVTRKSG
ncbi:NfeD family protein [Hyphococcus luteus]|jgi:membrane protein implicated in regulation of membrane protease activity|uniref:NfeD-like C-terminal domain-containing protein n=1 Tax=Hyphococcus luteus TaxID=2058213 RepID=A0A2S7K6K1_9PROT|nr:NfeD family protein [Marinicaulis flavus]PQA88145.1 hypothetical protein CW354_07460 [Marinicaulis flavus]